MKFFKDAWSTITETIDKFTIDKGPKLAGALSFFTMFSMAPLLLISIVIAGSIFGEEAARGELVAQIQDLVGRNGAELLQSAVQNASETESSRIATIISIVTLLIASTAVFVELQDSLNMIWRVKPKTRYWIKDLLRDRLIGFIMVICVGFLLLVSLVLSTVITLVSNFVGDLFTIPIGLLNATNLVLTFFIFFILFLLIYQVLPDVELKWRDVWLGSVVTTILFSIGKYLIGLYLGNSIYTSMYGAAGSLAVLLIWIYYSAMILFLGAEFTYVYAVKFGSGVRPRRGAKSVTKLEGTYELQTKEEREEVHRSSD